MQYMIVERFKKNKVRAVYERFDEKGRLMPEGLVYIDSWIDEKVETCFQLMESPSREKLEEWISNWDDLTDFEIFPVISSDRARAKVLKT